ncbi:bifunctional alpha/beta hydrolase/OsmC family protein [Sphingomicrobium clamense]|uniref:Bifunctional alpha/beta hydrolase/OsmC family protein n=1 Tax=Sphingomicrobium clamense TaxID=2851013 RepID=A0ABS6V599_9SPHN|nr:bifunctional alpha/beta hydrolase/OsmC family protein [Sphingomicrobium sp. B8]MBW0144739.1 bifunctional alpha/beta hydrolase/OsmC family protein [Sphingomicrobium sp. B8]
MITTEPYRFTGAGGMTLDGRLEKPRYGTPRAVAIFAHCFTCGKDSRAATFITRALAAQGIMVLRFDFVGLGGSAGDLSGFASQVADLEAAANALEADGHAPSLLIGHSLGGAAVIAAAGQCETVRAVATIGAPSDTDHVLTHLGDSIEEIEVEGEAVVKLAGRDFCIKKDFIEDTRGQRQEDAIRNLGKPLLILHSPTDEIVSVEHARTIYETARHPKSFIALDGASHLLTDDENAHYAADLIAAWGSRYAEGDRVEEEERPLEGVVRVTTAGGKFAQHVMTGTHDFIADEPKSYGGEDDGPTPYDLLLASLGTCTSMTMKMYADRKGMKLDKVRIELEHSRDHAKDCADCDFENGKQIQAIDRAIELEGELSDEERAKLLEIADKCPVHRTLESELHIHTTEVK